MDRMTPKAYGEKQPNPDRFLQDFFNLVAVTSKRGSEFLVVHAPVDGSLADLQTARMNDR